MARKYSWRQKKDKFRTMCDSCNAYKCPDIEEMLTAFLIDGIPCNKRVPASFHERIAHE